MARKLKAETETEIVIDAIHEYSENFIMDYLTLFQMLGGATKIGERLEVLSKMEEMISPEDTDFIEFLKKFLSELFNFMSQKQTELETYMENLMKAIH